MIEKYIYDLLAEYSKVYIPKIGSFLRKVEDETSESHTYAQPKLVIKVESDYSDDRLLVNAIANGEHISLEEAEALIHEKVDSILDHIRTYDYYEFDKLGKLSKDNYGNFQFETNPSLQEENFGLPNEIKANPLEENEYEGGKKYDYTALWIVSIVLIISAIVVYFVFFKEPKKEESDLITTPTPTQVDTTQTAPSTAPTSSSIILTEKTGRYYVIVGSFVVENNATQYRAKLASQGFDAKILQPSYKKVYRVTIADFADFKSASAKAAELTSEYEHWVLQF